MSTATVTQSSHKNDGTGSFTVQFTLSPATNRYIVLTHTTPVYTNLVASNITGGGIYIASPFSMQTPASTAVTFTLTYNIPGDTNTSGFTWVVRNSANNNLISTNLLNSTTNLLTLTGVTLNMIRGTFTVLTAPTNRAFVNFTLSGLNWSNSGIATNLGFSIERISATLLKLSIGTNTVGQTITNIKVLQ